MPKNYTSTTFSEVYKDDYADSNGFHRILFNSGRPLQARELTQLQTILQEQIRRFADNVFLDGAATGSAGTGLFCVSYVVVESIPSSYSAEDYIGVTLQGPSTSDTDGLQFLVAHAEQDIDAESAVLFGVYRSINQITSNQDTQETSPVFVEGDTLQDIRTLSGLSGNASLEVKVQPPSSTIESTGRGLLFGTEKCNFWVNGYFVFAPQQLIAVSKYDGNADVDVGFEIIRDIVTEEDDESLYDNQGSVPNLSSPGADRFRIQLKLTTRSSVTSSNDFVYYASVRGGRITQVKGGSESYNQIEQRMALRHYETHGNFEVVPFEVRHLPGDSDGVLNLRIPGMNSQGLIPSAYVDGYRLVHPTDETFLVHKPVSTSSQTNQLATVDYKNYVTVPYDSAGRNYLGHLPDFVDLQTQTKLRIADVRGTTLADARVKHIASTLKPEGFRIHLYDLRMRDGYDLKDAHTIFHEDGTCTPPANFSDSYATYEPSILYIYANDYERSDDRAISFTDADAQEFNDHFSAYSGRNFEQAGLRYWMRTYNRLAASGLSNSEAKALTKSTIDQGYEEDEGLNGAIVSTLTFCDRLEGTAVLLGKNENGVADIIDPNISTTLHKIPGGRVKSVSNSTFTVQRQFTATAASNSISITTGNNEEFDDLALWTFVNTSQDEQEEVPVGNISLNSSSPQTATINGLSGLSDNYTVFAYVKKNSPQPKLKTFTKHSTPISTSLSVDSAGPRFVFDLYDAISVTDVRADSANGRDIKDYLVFDNGQRDNYYSPVSLIPDGLPSDVNTVFAKFNYFEWDLSGDYFIPNSYILNDSFTYADIPVFRSRRDGSYYDLRNHFDFRPKLNPSADSMPETDRFEVPRDGDTITYDVEWYNKRIDHVSVGYNKNDFTTEVRINKGPESLDPKPPAYKVNEMALYEVEYNGNTADIKDLSVTKFKNKRFTMEDISKLEDRIETLEEEVSLSNLEKDIVNVVELNSSGEVRAKTAFFADDFKQGFNKTASSREPFWVDDTISQSQSIYNVSGNNYLIGPRSRVETVQMLFDSNNSFSGRTSQPRADVLRKGDLLYIDYREVLDSSLINENISWTDDGQYSGRGWFNVNPFDIYSGEGFLKLSPATDMWNDNYHIPNRSNTPTEEELRNEFPARNTGTELNSFKTTIKSFVYTSPDIIGQDVEAYAVPYARQKEIFAKAQGLKPNTRYWPFFDGVNVEQWIYALTSTEYADHLKADDHLKTAPEVDVSITQHPRRSIGSDSVLITDANGDVYFSFWLPNTARVPTSNFNSLSSVEEWETWIRAQRDKSREYSEGPLDPRVYDDIGWKFRTGSVELLLNDNSTRTTTACQSSAVANYISSGSLLLSEKTIHMTRPVNKKNPVYSQPLAQTFSVDGRTGVPGVFVTKIDVFVRNAPQSAARGGIDAAIPLQLQIREVENGSPTSYPAGEQYRIYKSADEIYDIVNNIVDKEDIDDVLSNPVSFVFPEPVYLQANETYAIVLTSECNDYEVFISTENDLVLGKSDERVAERPAIGSLLSSKNGLDWSVNASKNLTYRIHTAKFKDYGSFNLYNQKYTKYNHNTKMMRVESGDLTRFRVKHYGHGLGVGDKIGLTGLDSSSTYLGVSGVDLMDPTLTVDSADAAGYYVKLPSSTFASTGSFGENTAKSNRAFNFDRATYNVESKEYPGTEIIYEGNFATGVSHARIDLTRTADPRFNITQTNTPFSANREMYYNSPRMLANPVQEYENVGASNDSAPSVVLGAQFKTTTTSTFGGPLAASLSSSGYVSDVSPVIDLQRSVLAMENSIIDNQSGPGFISDEFATYVINQTVIYNDGYVVVGWALVDTIIDSIAGQLNTYFESISGRPFEQEGLAYWMRTYNRYVREGLSSAAAVTKAQGAIQVAWDQEEATHNGVRRIIDPTTINSNKPNAYVPETHRTDGTSASKHLIRPVVLTQSSNGIRVLIDAFNPPSADFDLYYRVVSEPDDDIYEEPFVKVESQNEPGKNPFNPDTFDLSNLPSSEYRYLIGGPDGNLKDFAKFQLKVVMRSTNTSESPFIKSIRAVALI